MIKILNMEAKHIDEVVSVEEECFHTPWTKKDFEREMHENSMAIYKIAILDGKIIGYAGMWHIVNEGHITNVAVLPEYRRTGVGNLLVEELIRIAQELEMIGLTLEVRISNMAAQRLYIKYGFRSEGFRKRYYDDTGEDAIIMWKYFENYENFEKVK